MVKIKAYRLSGEAKSIDEVLTWIRHITYREYSNQDIVIIMLDSDYENLQQACKKCSSVMFEECGSANMALTKLAVVK